MRTFFGVFGGSREEMGRKAPRKPGLEYDQSRIPFGAVPIIRLAETHRRTIFRTGVFARE